MSHAVSFSSTRVEASVSLFFADYDVNRAVIYHFDHKPPPATGGGKKLTSYIKEAIKKIHFTSAPAIKYFYRDDPPHMPDSPAPPTDDAASSLPENVDDLTPSTQIGVRNVVAERVPPPPP